MWFSRPSKSAAMASGARGARFLPLSQRRPAISQLERAEPGVWRGRAIVSASARAALRLVPSSAWASWRKGHAPSIRSGAVSTVTRVPIVLHPRQRPMSVR